MSERKRKEQRVANLKELYGEECKPRTIRYPVSILEKIDKEDIDPVQILIAVLHDSGKNNPSESFSRLSVFDKKLLGKIVCVLAAVQAPADNFSDAEWKRVSEIFKQVNGDHKKMIQDIKKKIKGGK